MKMSAKGRYGIRLMVALLKHYGEGPVSVKHISEKEKISIDYIEQLFIRLKKCGFVKSVRGPGGGFLLAKLPSKVKIGDILRCVEEQIAFAPCVETKLNTARCVLTDRCVVHGFFKRISAKLEKIMDSTSLADLCKFR